MKKRIKAVKDLTPGDTIKITGYSFEVEDDVIVTGTQVSVSLWCWASPRKRITMVWNDPQFPVTVR